MENVLEAILKAQLNKLEGTSSSTSYLLACSGGKDSMVLMEAMTQICEKSQLLIAHYNHKTRLEESDADEQFVSDEVKKRGLRILVGKSNAKARTEEDLRLKRYDFLNECRNKYSIDYILTAHHAMDQLETLLMRLVRGTGLDGLGCIPRQNGVYLRPMLGVVPSEIEAYLKLRKVSFREDSSNFSLDYERNRIRHKVIPKLLEKCVDEDSALRRIVSTTDELVWVKRRLDESIEGIYKTLVFETPYWFRIPIRDFLQIQPAEQLRILRRAFKKIEPSKTPSRNAIVHLLYSLKSGKSEEHLTGKLRVSQSCGQIFLHRPDSKEALLKLKIQKSQTNCISVEQLGLTIKLPGLWQDNFDARFIKPGDRQAGTKLKSLLLDRRIPRPERALLPILLDRQTRNVFWFFPQQHSEITVIKNNFPFSFLSPA